MHHQDLFFRIFAGDDVLTSYKIADEKFLIGQELFHRNGLRLCD